MEYIKNKLFLLVTLIIAASLLCSCSPSKSQLHRIGTEAYDMYVSDYLPRFNKFLQKETGFSDLTVNVNEIDFEHGIQYCEDSNEVIIRLHFSYLKSDDIDQFFTKKDDENGRELRFRMKKMLEDLIAGDNFSYQTQNGMTVNVYVDLIGSSDCTVYTSSGQKYSYWHIDESEWVKINDTYFVYFRSGRSNESTIMAHSSKSESSKNTASTKSSGYSFSGSSKKYYNSDPYDVETYDDPDDFANDYEDDFEDYDDAYDYWEEEHY